MGMNVKIAGGPGFMGAYESFARVYDLFMDNIPYEEWCGYLETLLKEYGYS